MKNINEINLTAGSEKAERNSIVLDEEPLFLEHGELGIQVQDWFEGHGRFQANIRRPLLIASQVVQISNFSVRRRTPVPPLEDNKEAHQDGVRVGLELEWSHLQISDEADYLGVDGRNGTAHTVAPTIRKIPFRRVIWHNSSPWQHHERSISPKRTRYGVELLLFEGARKTIGRRIQKFLGTIPIH